MSRLIRALGALATLAGLMVGVPWLLIRLAGWPLPTKVPDWSNAARMIEQGDIAGTTVVNVLACIVWAAWIVVAWAVLWEAVVNVPRMVKGRRHRSNPLAPAAVSKGVGWLFTVIIATTAVSQPAYAAPSLGSLAASDPDDGPDIALVVEADATTSATVARDSPGAFDHVDDLSTGDLWIADDSDSLWSIAQHVGLSVDEILDHNDTLSPTTMLAEGMRIRLPAGADIPDERRAAAADDAVGFIDDSPTVESTVTVRSYVVRQNDGMWNVAEALLGDGSRHVEMAELAIGQQVAPGVTFTADTYVIHPGWVFTLDSSVPVADQTPADSYRVVDGDSLWSIADDELDDAERWTELWVLNRGETMNDGHVFDDPDLIRVGWNLQLPVTAPIDTPDEASPADPAPAIAESPDAGEVAVEPTVEVIDGTDVAENSDPEPGAVDQPGVVSAATETPDDVESAVAEEAPVSVDVEAALPPATAPNRAGTRPPRVSVPASNVVGDGSAMTEAAPGWDRSVWSQIAAGTLLLAGLGAMVRRLRNRRLARLEPGRRLVQPPEVASGTELAVTQTPELLAELSTLRGLMQSITPYAAEQSDPPAVRAVQIGDERVEILFAAPAPLPPKGWSTIDGGRSWTHRFVDEPVTSRQLLTPALVTIGIRGDDGRDEVLLDLETAASVAIIGDSDASMGLARSMALELATYPLGVPVEVCLIGLHVDGTETCDRVWLDTTLQRAVRITRERLKHIGIQGASSMVAARAELNEDDGAHDPMVFFVNVAAVSVADRALLDELIDICQPSTGTGVVLVGDHLGAKERITIDADSRTMWSDVALAAPNVTLQAAAEAAVMLDHAANAESEPMEPSELMVALLELTNDDEDFGAEADTSESGPVLAVVHDEPVDVDPEVVPEYEYRAPSHDVLLRVMGEVEVEGCELTYDDVELLGVMACLRGTTSVHVDLIQNLIAPDSVRKTVENRVSRLRKKLGIGSDDLDLLPAASATGRGLNAMYEISPLVLTDVDLLEHRLHTAHTLGSTDALRVLRDGLDLMHGPLFRARKGFDGWPHTEGVVQAMTVVITNYARQLIELAVEVDDIALVVRTSAAAGRVLDNPAVESPFRQVEEQYAEACGDEQLIASVNGARQRLLEYLRDEDSLAAS